MFMPFFFEFCWTKMLAKNLNYKPCSHEVRAIFQRGLSQRQGKAYDHHGVWTTYIHLDDFFHEFTLEFLPPQKKCLDPKITASQTIRSFSSSFFYLYFPGLNLGDARPLVVATMKKVWLLQLECWSSMPPVRNQKWLKIEIWPHEFLEFWTPSLRKDMLNLSKVQKLPSKHETFYNLWYSRSSCRSSPAIFWWDFLEHG